MFGNNNGGKPPEPIPIQLPVFQGDEWILIKSIPAGEGRTNFNIAGSERYQDPLDLINAVHQALAALTGIILASRKKDNRIIQVPPGTTLRKP